MKGSQEQYREHTIRHILCFVKQKSSREDSHKATYFCDYLGWTLPIPVLNVN